MPAELIHSKSFGAQGVGEGGGRGWEGCWGRGKGVRRRRRRGVERKHDHQLASLRRIANPKPSQVDVV